MIVTVGSLKGSPGATTLALALADRWPSDSGEPLVVEADPAGGDVAARFGLVSGRGLVSLAAAGRRGSGGQRQLADHVQELPGGLQVLSVPAGAEQARQVLGELGGGGWSLLWSAARENSRTVIVDCGRLDDPLSPAAPAVRTADVLLLVVRGRDDELAHLAARMSVVQGWHVPNWFVVIAGQPGRARDYRMREISRVLGSRTLGPLPFDARAAGVLAGRGHARAGIGRSRLGRTVNGLAGYLSTLATFNTGGSLARPDGALIVPSQPGVR